MGMVENKGFHPTSTDSLLTRMGFPLKTGSLLPALRNIVSDDTPVLLAGSWAEGRGYSGADIDLFAFPDGDPTAPPAIAHLDVEGRELDVEAWTRSYAEALITRYEGLNPERMDALPPVTFKEHRLLHALRVGIHLRGSNYLAYRTERLAGSAFIQVEVLRRYRDFLKVRKAIDSTLAGGHLLAALLELETAVHLAADAYLLAHGETNPRRRWLFDRFAALGSAGELFRQEVVQYRFPMVNLNDADQLTTLIQAGTSFVAATYRDLLGKFGFMTTPEPGTTAAWE